MSVNLTQPCFLCGDHFYGSICLCPACMNELPFIKTACNRCGLPMEMETETETCGACISDMPPVNHCTSVLHYDSPVDFLIKHMKYHNQLSVAELLGTLLAEKVSADLLLHSLPTPETIIPMPLHLDRLKQRGYNQALEIARPISNILNIPIDLDMCTRTISTAPQFDLPAAERGDNIKNAFTVNNPLPVRHIALLDDVMTTGSTVWEVAKTLRKAGVERIDVWTCARATTH